MFKKFLTSLVLFSATCFAAAQQARHVVVISIDGVRTDLYKDASWGAVNLLQPMRDGVHAQGVQDVFPSVTYPLEQGRDGDKVRQAVASADRAVKTLLEAIDKAGITDSTAVIVSGDHGFSDIHTSLLRNIWLKENGFSKPSQANSKDNWKALFHTAGGGAFLHLKNKHDQATLIKVKDILNKLPVGQTRMFRIIERRELDSRGADPNIALALATVKGVSFGAPDKGTQPVVAASGNTHGYCPDLKKLQTGFIGYGAGLKKGAVLPIMGFQDMAPIISNPSRYPVPCSRWCTLSRDIEFQKNKIIKNYL